MKKLLNHISTEWHKYVLEVFVVIIGILIALGLNNWNENRKNNSLKDRYLRALVLDLNGDIDNLNSWKKGNDNAEKEGLYLLDYLENRLTILDSQRLARSFLLSEYKPVITLSSSTYNDLISSGNIRIFEDLNFKKQLDEYYKKDTWSLKIDDRITKTIWYDYRDKITEFVDPTLFKALYNAGPFSPEAKKIDLMVYDIEWNTLKKSPELLRQLRNVLAYRVAIRDDLKNHLISSVNLLNMIKSQIN